LKKAIHTDKELITEILLSAFIPLKGDSSINFVVKQDKKRVQRMRVLMEYLFERAFLFGEIYISDNKKACLLLKFSNRENINLKTIWLDLHLAYNCIGIERVHSVLKRQRITQQHYPKEAHIRPMIMGVMADCKGHGTAARLMIEVKNKFKGNQLPVIVDAASKHNAQLYQKFGFKMLKKEEALGFPIYFLRMN